MSRLLTRLGTEEARRGNRKSVAWRGERRVIMSTMASLINDEDSAQSGQLSAEN